MRTEAVADEKYLVTLKVQISPYKKMEGRVLDFNKKEEAIDFANLSFTDLSTRNNNSYCAVTLSKVSNGVNKIMFTCTSHKTMEFIRDQNV